MAYLFFRRWLIGCIVFSLAFFGYLAARIITVSGPVAILHCNIWKILSDHLQFDEPGGSVQWSAPRERVQRGSDGIKGIDRSNRVFHTFLDTQYPVVRADRLRYIVLDTDGGIFVPEAELETPYRAFVEVRARVIMGIEYEYLDRDPLQGFTERMAFCQWTVSTTIDSPIPAPAVQCVISALRRTADQRRSKLLTMYPPAKVVRLVSGLGVWTDAVMESLSAATGIGLTYMNITASRQPCLLGHILVLPVDTFGTGRPQSGRSQKLVQNQFKM